MNASKTRTRTGRSVVGILAIFVLAAWAVAAEVAATPVDGGRAQPPRMDVVCDIELCVAQVRYDLGVDDDSHEVRLVWETHPTPSYPDNDADTVRRVRPGQLLDEPGSGVGEAHRYYASDVIWHSDIRCDSTVQVTVLLPDGTTTTQTTAKAVPASPDEAHCSAYGIR